MTSQTGQQKIIIGILPNILINKGNQSMKFSQLINVMREIFFFKNHAENEAGKLVPDLFIF